MAHTTRPGSGGKSVEECGKSAGRELKSGGRVFNSISMALLIRKCALPLSHLLDTLDQFSCRRGRGGAEHGLLLIVE